MLRLKKKLGPLIVASGPNDNVNGPSVIKVPEWVDSPLGKYYMYYAHHIGNHIRMAYADKITGPWRIYEPGVLQLKDTPCFDHIASPDVHVNDYDITMYYHGKYHTSDSSRGQYTFAAQSRNGLEFFPVSDSIIAPFYFRKFPFDMRGIAKINNDGLMLFEGKDKYETFSPLSEVIKNGRHAAVFQSHYPAVLYILYTRMGDSPERILYNSYSPAGDLLCFEKELLHPTEEYEGANLPVHPSRPGSSFHEVNQVRDPYVFEDTDGKLYLFYSIKGEKGIALAEIERMAT